MDLLINFRSLADQLDEAEFDSFTRANSEVIVDGVLREKGRDWITRQLFDHLLKQQQKQSTASVAATSTSTLIESINDILRKNDNPAKKETDKLPLNLSNLTKGLLGSIASYLKLDDLREFMKVSRNCYIAGSSPIAWSGYNSLDIPCDIEPYYDFCTSVQHRAFNIQWFRNVRNMTTGDLGENRFAEIMHLLDNGEVVFKNLKILRIGGDFDGNSVNPFGLIVSREIGNIPIVLGLNCFPKQTLETLELEGLCDRDAIPFIFQAVSGFPNITSLKLIYCGYSGLTIDNLPDIDEELSELTKYTSDCTGSVLSGLIINSKCKQLKEIVIEDIHADESFPEINAAATFDALEVFVCNMQNQMSITAQELILRTAPKLRSIRMENYFLCSLSTESLGLLARLKSLQCVELRELGNLNVVNQIMEIISDRILEHHQQDKLKCFSLKVSTTQVENIKFKDVENALLSNMAKAASILLQCVEERFSVRLEYDLVDDESDQIDFDKMRAKMMAHINESGNKHCFLCEKKQHDASQVIKIVINNNSL